MVATIRDTRKEIKDRKPVLVGRVDDFECDVVAAIILAKEDGLISIHDDRQVAVIFKL